MIDDVDFFWRCQSAVDDVRLASIDGKHTFVCHTKHSNILRYSSHGQYRLLNPLYASERAETDPQLPLTLLTAAQGKPMVCSRSLSPDDHLQHERYLTSLCHG